MFIDSVRPYFQFRQDNFLLAPWPPGSNIPLWPSLRRNYPDESFSFLPFLLHKAGKSSLSS